MEKKLNYDAPHMEVVVLKSQGHLLAGSQQGGTGDQEDGARGFDFNED
ncbi:hypothetical protein M1D30_02415 [Prevotella sp. E15-22]|nr:hypothetical protein [Prevotella sp. E15-22]UPS45038.1 hypothetical protein M1D30_02415 [Prevotella sp. E15-22]